MQMTEKPRSGHSRNVAGLERASGLAIIVALTLGLAAANSPLASSYAYLHHLPVHAGIGPLVFRDPLIGLINDGLMVFFFLLVGLELKRELLEGALAMPRAAALPVFAALGGMAVPALIYTAINWNDPVAIRGWAIPTATDIVLALGVLTLVGARLPSALKVFLTAIAIFDDIGAVLLIALFYSKGVSFTGIVVTALALCGLAILGARRITRPLPYVVGGLVLWIAMFKASIEPALAGVLIGATVPLHAPKGGHNSPLREAEHQLRPWVALGVVPLFVFFNSGIAIDNGSLDALLSGASLGIILGLFFGKQLGIFGVAWLAVATGIARLPSGLNWLHVYGMAAVAGIGFTMSLFIATLAFTQPGEIASVKLAVLVGSAVSAAAGLIALSISVRLHASNH